MGRWRKALALFCVAAIAFAAVVPADAAACALAFLVPVWLEFQPDLAVVLAPVDSLPTAERSVSLRSAVAFRGPPSTPPA